jgi:hypothetical protein
VATISGTPPNQILDLTVPRGDTGATGDVAPGNIGNLLTAAQATVNTTGLFTPANCTESTAGVFTATATGTISARLPTLTVVPGDTVTFRSTIAATGRTIRSGIQFRNAADSANVGSASYSATIAAGASGICGITVVVPAGAERVRFYPMWSVGSGSVGDTGTVTSIGYWIGSGGLWVPPGVPVPNLGTRANPADATQVQVWNPGNATWITV